AATDWRSHSFRRSRISSHWASPSAVSALSRSWVSSERLASTALSRVTSKRSSAVWRNRWNSTVASRVALSAVSAGWTRFSSRFRAVRNDASTLRIEIPPSSTSRRVSPRTTAKAAAMRRFTVQLTTPSSTVGVEQIARGDHLYRFGRDAIQVAVTAACSAGQGLHRGDRYLEEVQDGVDEHREDRSPLAEHQCLPRTMVDRRMTQDPAEIEQRHEPPPAGADPRHG